MLHGLDGIALSGEIYLVSCRLVGRLRRWELQLIAWHVFWIGGCGRSGLGDGMGLLVGSWDGKCWNLDVVVFGTGVWGLGRFVMGGGGYFYFVTLRPGLGVWDEDWLYCVEMALLFVCFPGYVSE